MQLRQYQRDAIDAIYDYWGNIGDHPIIVAPTGSGKSLIQAVFVDEATTQYPDTRVLLLAHRKELIQQNSQELEQVNPDIKYGIYHAGLNRRDKKPNIIFAGIDSIYKKITDFEPFDLIVIDEAHMVPPKANTKYGKLLTEAHLCNPDVKVLGLTASPYRLDSGKLVNGGLFDGIAYDIPIADLVNDGYLAPIISKGGAVKADLSSVKKRGGEYVNSDLDKAFNQDDITATACDEIIEYGQDRKGWLIFACSVDHAEHIKEYIQKRGVSCECITGDTPKAQRQSIIDDYKAQRIRCLVNCDVLTTGFNAPHTDLGAMLRATQSPALYVQIVGRLMRTYQNKDNALLLDYGGNVERHGPIDQIQPKEPGAGDGDAPAKECPNCMHIIAAGCRECPECGFLFPEPEVKHEKTAYDGAVMSSQAGTWVHVQDVSYHRHVKAGKPDSVRVEYMTEYGVYKDWLMPEHKGVANAKTVQKLMQMGFRRIPKTANELLDNVSNIPTPLFIMPVRDGKYWRISGVWYDRSTEIHEPGRAERAAS